MTSLGTGMPSTRIRQNATVILAFALISISGLLFLALNTGQRFGPLPPQYRVSFDVKDADGLVEGSDVRIAGIPVGKVLAVMTTSRGARVTMGLEPGKGYDPVYTDGTVLIRPKSLQGEKYVDLQRGVSNVEIPDGGLLPPSQAFTQVEIDQVLNSSDPTTRAAMSANIITLGQGLKGRGADLNATIPELRRIAEHLTSVSSRFKDRTAQIDHILVDTDTILTTLSDEHAQLATLLQSADSVTGTIAQNDSHLAGLLNGAGGTFLRLNDAVAQQGNDQNIRTSIEQLPAMVSKLDTFFSLTNHSLDTIVPSLLLGQQFGFPNSLLSVATPSALQMDQRWDSANRTLDSGPGGTGLVANNLWPGFAGLAVRCDMLQLAVTDTTLVPSGQRALVKGASYSSLNLAGPLQSALGPGTRLTLTTKGTILDGWIPPPPATPIAPGPGTQDVTTTGSTPAGATTISVQSFTANSVFPTGTVILGDGSHPCPGFAGGKAPGYGSLRALSMGASPSYVPASATQANGNTDLSRVFLDYLLSN
jgi:virulence factor Mce-like protein